MIGGLCTLDRGAVLATLLHNLRAELEELRQEIKG